MEGFNALQMTWLVGIDHQSDTIAYEYALNKDPGFLELFSEAKRIIPPEFCITGSYFNGLALVLHWWLVVMLSLFILILVTITPIY